VISELKNDLETLDWQTKRLVTEIAEYKNKEKNEIIATD